jgi:hypothetical protein
MVLIIQPMEHCLPYGGPLVLNSTHLCKKSKFNNGTDTPTPLFFTAYLRQYGMDVHATPTIFINGNQLPDAYSIEDLQYFLLG